jgi:PIN domain nuclease of toxin-antitoxin system
VERAGQGAAPVILLDTAAWIWWVSNPTSLSARARQAIVTEEATSGLLVSAISVWEVAVKVALRKLTLDRDVRTWVAMASAYPGLTVLPLDPTDALESTLLPGRFHKDPADRMIIAIARRLDVPLVTSDRAIRRYRHVRTIW